MKISALTTKLLKSYVEINPAILVRPGEVLETVSPAKSILASAKTDQKFDSQFSLDDVSKFLGALGLFENPDVEFGERQLTISEGRQSVNIVYCDVNRIVTVPEKPPKMPPADVEFELGADLLKKARQGQAVLRVPEFVIIGDGKDITFGSEASTNPTTNSFRLKVGETKTKFKAVIRSENLRVIPDDYKVSVTFKGISYWAGKTASYFIAIEDNSRFGEETPARRPAAAAKTAAQERGPRVEVEPELIDEETPF